MEFTAKQIAQFVQGVVEGDENASVTTFTKIEEGVPGAISFLANPKYTHYLYETKSSVVLVDKSIELDKPVETTLIRVDNARDCVAKLLQLYESMKPKKQGVDKMAFISESAKIGDNVYIGAFAYIGDNVVVGDGCQIYPNATICDNVKLGNNCILYPNTTVYHDCRLGNEVILHAGSVVGADGFGFAPNAETNSYDKIPQIGNLVQIAHNTDIGENTVMSAQVGIAGSTKVGQWCMFGGQVGIAGHITIGNKVFLGAQSGVPGSLKDNQTLIGTPPTDQRSFFKSQAIIRRLPEIYKQLNDLQKEVEELKKQKQD